MKSFITLVTALFGITAGSYSSYEFLRPKNLAQYLEWKGYSLISSDSAWEAIYYENSKEFSSVKELRN